MPSVSQGFCELLSISENSFTFSIAEQTVAKKYSIRFESFEKGSPLKIQA